MMNLLSLWLSLLALTELGLSTPVPLADPQRRPLVIWHGLGDSYASPGMLEFMQRIKDIHPGIFIHSVRLSEDLEQDQKAGFVSSALAASNMWAQLTGREQVW